MENLPIEYRDGSSPMPSRKRLDHRGPLSMDVSSACYFITICASERVQYGRVAVPSATVVRNETEAR